MYPAHNREHLRKVLCQRLKPCSPKGQGQANEDMPRFHLIRGLDGEFADILDARGSRDADGVEPRISADGKKNRTIRRVETGGIAITRG